MGLCDRMAFGSELKGARNIVSNIVEIIPRNIPVKNNRHGATEKDFGAKHEVKNRHQNGGDNEPTDQSKMSGYI